VLDGSAVIDLEYSALKMLTEKERSLRREGILLALAGLSPSVLELVRRSELGRVLGDERMLANLQVAVERYERLAAGAASEGAETNPG
jgi:hypothetical protein